MIRLVTRPARTEDESDGPVRFWGNRALIALAAMHLAIADGDDRDAAYYAAVARRLAIYAGTAARVLKGVR